MAGALFVAIPLAAVIGALLVTHMFTERYALIGLVGFCLLTPLVAAEFFGRRGAAGIVLLGVLVWGAAIRLVDYQAKGNPFAGEPLLMEALEQGPVVIADGQLYMQMWHYAPERLKARMLFLADDVSAVKYMGFETIDGGIRALIPWAPVQVREYARVRRARQGVPGLSELAASGLGVVAGGGRWGQRGNPEGSDLPGIGERAITRLMETYAGSLRIGAVSHSAKKRKRREEFRRKPKGREVR